MRLRNFKDHLRKWLKIICLVFRLLFQEVFKYVKLGSSTGGVREDKKPSHNNVF